MDENPAQNSPKLLSRLSIIVILQCIIIIGLLVLIAVCYQDYKSSALPVSELSSVTIFERTISDAALADPNRIVRNLFALNDENRLLETKQQDDQLFVKAVAWMSEASYQNYYADELNDCKDTPQTCVYKDKLKTSSPSVNQALTWVTLVPQVKQFCHSLNYDDPSFRLKQYLGLDPNRRYERFVEVWLRPTDIFRPCIDPEPTDNACDLDLQTNTVPTVTNIPNYVEFFQKLKLSSYSPSGAPWTKLGYTYDWAYGERGVGASEYVIVPDTEFSIHRSYTTFEYCQ